jgi:uncharacterized membrane protein
MQFWTFLHILSMFGAVTVVVGAEVWANSAMRRSDLGALRAYFRISKRAEAIGGLLLLVGIAFGLIAAMTIGWDLTRGWLILAYVLVGLTIMVGAINQPFVKKVEAALEANEGDEPGPELSTLMSSPRTLIVPALDILIIGTIIWDMVFKPAF